LEIIALLRCDQGIGSVSFSSSSYSPLGLVMRGHGASSASKAHKRRKNSRMGDIMCSFADSSLFSCRYSMRRVCKRRDTFLEMLMRRWDT
jgi:hypothetical protein